MKNIIVAISVSGIVFFLILVAAIVFQKTNMLDSIKNADNALNKEMNTIENSLIKNPQETPPTAEQAPEVPVAEQPATPTQVTPQETPPTAEQAPEVPVAEQPATPM